MSTTIVIVAAIDVTTPFVTATAVPETPRSDLMSVPAAASGPARRGGIGLEEAEPAATFGQVLQVLGHRVDEVVHLVDERRDERQPEIDDHAEQRAGR